MPARQTIATLPSIYQRIGVKKIINARGATTVMGNAVNVGKLW